MERYTHLGVYGLMVWEQEVLLIQKARGPYQGTWDLPGGRLEFGETPELALHREIEEETGLTDVRLSLRSAQSNLVQWMHEGSLEEVHHIGILYDVYLGSDGQAYGIKKEADGEDSLGAAWFTMEQLDSLALTPFALHMIQDRMEL
ncbi:NUDIX domain-containing protein [Paenibacillus tundrae]|uniref:ADP-ribose pyrophosphatase YjhB (NUDIX family) n=1 Tax=Paenibacillus tundrae TaxID=528187 RepID=A0ABT9WBT7_9BACL|nr:NUDIX domain-containing protein [Paenibacillus tundrae]MDQ0170725.1 ADP-ribose pyrophosphatase YjhB (NUDIX family) [Paenibacillus tundrae]